MKRYIIIIAALAAALSAAAQTTAEEFNEKYTRLISRLGYAGVGIETYLDKWETAFPEDGRMLEARCNYFLEKAMITQLIQKDKDKFLGNKPVLSVPDSTGKVVNYFQESFFDDELFGQAVSYIYKAIELYPQDLVYRADLISCLLAYEKESPDMAVREMQKLIDKEKKEKPDWTVKGAPAGEEDFSQLMSEYCVTLWEIGTPTAYDSFFVLSTQLSKLFPKNSNYIDNLGSFWLVAKSNEKKAMRLYKKALKLDPDDQVAKTNIRIIERRQAAAKKKKS